MDNCLPPEAWRSEAFAEDLCDELPPLERRERRAAARPAWLDRLGLRPGAALARAATGWRLQGVTHTRP